MALRPPFTRFPELTTKRLALREATTADLPKLLEILTYDGKTCSTEEEGMQVLKKIAGDYTNGQGINWCIASKQSNEALGFIGYYRGFAEETGEIGFILRPDFRGKGYMTEALLSAAQFGKKELCLRRVLAYTKSDNEAAINVLQKQHFVSVPSSDPKYVCLEYIPS